MLKKPESLFLKEKAEGIPAFGFLFFPSLQNTWQPT